MCFKAREELIARKSVEQTKEGKREREVMVVEGGSCEKDLRLVGREFHRHGDELQKERSENLSLKVRSERERQKWLEERVLPVSLMLMRLCK